MAERQKFCGSLEHANNTILQDYLENAESNYETTYDLEMVVYCVFHRMCPSEYKSIHYRSINADATKRVTWIRNFRKQHLSGLPWSRLFEAARSGYVELKTAITNLKLVGIDQDNNDESPLSPGPPTTAAPTPTTPAPTDS